MLMQSNEEKLQHCGINNDYSVLTDVLPGNKKVLPMAGSVNLNNKLRSLGYEVYGPDMSMFTFGGGGVHCMCQALRRLPV